MSQLILLRHGQSMWNKENVFTGWVDVPLSAQGIQEALNAGERLADIDFSAVFVSELDRALATAMLCLSKTGTQKTPFIVHEDGDKRELWARVHDEAMLDRMIPVYRDWHLNERYYGQLQGQNKQVMADRYGKEQIQIWRRSYDQAPPDGESLKDTAARTLPFFDEKIMPVLAKGNVLVAAHGNSLRSIVMKLDNLTPEEVLQLEIPTGQPTIYQYQNKKIIKMGD